MLAVLRLQHCMIRGDHMKRTPAAAALVTAASLALALAGCGAAAGAGSVPTVTTTATVTATATATPSPVAASPDDPIDAQAAWTACAVLAQAEYGEQAPNAKLRPYDPSQAPTKNADGTWQAIVGFPIDPPVEGAASVVVICQIGGTLGDPSLIRWTAKDI